MAQIKASFRRERREGIVFSGGRVANVPSSSLVLCPEGNGATLISLVSDASFVSSFDGTSPGLCFAFSALATTAISERPSRVKAYFETDGSPCIAVGASLRFVAIASDSGLLQVYPLPSTFLPLSAQQLDQNETIPSNPASSSNKQSHDGNEYPTFKSPTFSAKIGMISHLTFDSSGRLLAAALTNGIIRIYDVARGYQTHHLKSHVGVLGHISFHPSPERELFLSCGGPQDLKIHFWDLSTKKIKATLSGGHFTPVTGSTYLHDEQLITVARDKILVEWDLRTFSLTRAIPTYEPMEDVISISLSQLSIPAEVNTGTLSKSDSKKRRNLQDKSVCLTIGDSGKLKVWDPSSASGKELVWEADERDSTLPPEAFFEQLFLLPSSTVLFVGTEQSLIVRDASTLTSLSQPPRVIVHGYLDEVTDLAWLPGANGHRFLAVATNSPQWKILDTHSGSWLPPPLSTQPHAENILAISATPGIVHTSTPSETGDYATSSLLISTSKGGELLLWKISYHQNIKHDRVDSVSVACLSAGKGHLGGIGAVAWSPTVNWFVTAGADSTLKIWDAPSAPYKVDSSLNNLRARAAVKAHTKEINCIAVSPNGALIDKTIGLWKLNGSQIENVGSLSGHRRGVWSIAFSPADQILASASSDSTIRIWSIESRECIRTLEGHTASVLRLMFVSQGLQLLSASGDGLMKLWTLKTSECIFTAEAHDEKIWALAVSAKEDIVATGGSDSTVSFWTDNTESIVKEKKAREDAIVKGNQHMENLLRNGHYVAALKLALELEQPQRALFIIEKLISSSSTSYDTPSYLEPDGSSDPTPLESLIRSLSREQLVLVLSWLRDWNTQLKNAPTCQLLLATILSTFSGSSLITIPNIKSLLQGLIPYTKRHLNHIQGLKREAHLLDYTLSEMGLPSKFQELDLSSDRMDVDADAAHVNDSAELDEQSAVTVSSLPLLPESEVIPVIAVTNTKKQKRLSAGKNESGKPASSKKQKVEAAEVADHTTVMSQEGGKSSSQKLESKKQGTSSPRTQENRTKTPKSHAEKTKSDSSKRSTNGTTTPKSNKKKLRLSQ